MYTRSIVKYTYMERLYFTKSRNKQLNSFRRGYFVGKCIFPSQYVLSNSVSDKFVKKIIQTKLLKIKQTFQRHSVTCNKDIIGEVG